MLCRESKRLLGAYVDNEVDVMTSLALEEHVGVCVVCTHALQTQRSIKKLIRDADLYFECPPSLRQELMRALAPEAGSSRPSRLRAGFRGWPVAAACAVFLLACGLYIFRFQPVESTWAQEVVDNHVRSMLVNHLTDVPSSDQHTVKPWFNGKLSFSPTVTDFTAKGYPLVGGRIDYMNHQAVAAIVYQRRQHIINVFSCPTNSNPSWATTELRGYNLIRWSDRGIEYWVVSDLNRPELEAFAQLLKD